MLKKWNDLPDSFKNPEVNFYYEILNKKRAQLFFKRLFDILISLILLILLSPIMIIIAITIKLDSKGPVFFRQKRITQYGKTFRMFKFRTMVENAEKLGSQVTVSNDPRVTKIGGFIRKYRIDEFPQLLNVLFGDMTFVGTRPEVKKYVDAYTNEMLATLLLPAGITSEASIRYKDEQRLLSSSADADKTYIEEILPEKMKYNLKGIEKTSIKYDLSIMLATVFGVLK